MCTGTAPPTPPWLCRTLIQVTPLLTSDEYIEAGLGRKVRYSTVPVGTTRNYTVQSKLPVCYDHNGPPPEKPAMEVNVLRRVLGDLDADDAAERLEPLLEHARAVIDDQARAASALCSPPRNLHAPPLLAFACADAPGRCRQAEGSETICLLLDWSPGSPAHVV